LQAFGHVARQGVEKRLTIEETGCHLLRGGIERAQVGGFAARLEGELGVFERQADYAHQRPAGGQVGGGE